MWRFFSFSMLIFLLIPDVSAESVETVMMPGKVIQGHVKWEEDCQTCHKPFDKAEQSRLCRDCHKEVTKDILHKQGFHGRLKEGSLCSECHTEHKGRSAQIAPINESTFKHAQTDFELKGAHAEAKVECKDCHRPKVKYRDTPNNCNDCHKKDDKHEGSLGAACADCHTEKSWKDTPQFDHNKSRFALEGKHIDVKCGDCHLTKKFRETPRDCFSCHKKNDKHEGALGNRCEKCHGETSWSATPGFKHDKDTKFPLLGQHKTAKCQSCHKNGIKEKLPLLCSECHRSDDKHKGNFGAKCDSCHTESDWKSASKFNHDRDTKFALLDKHKTVKCDACHKENLYQDELISTCIACHKQDDKHKGQEGDRCEDCHNSKSWKEAKFDHGKSRFPLLGKHNKVECKKCHLTSAFKDVKSECVVCHTKNDVHKRRMGTQCETCHNARDWKIWDFDHDRHTNFKLTGGHKGIECYACHKNPSIGTKLVTPTACVDCHSADDAHDGSFGRQCERCHVSTSFKELKMGTELTR